MGCRKGQMFLISMVFLVGLIFTVQTALLGYTSVDISESSQKTDRYLIENVINLINDTLNDPNTEYCNSGKDNFLDKMREIQTIVKEEYVRGMFSLKIIPILDCTKWNSQNEVVLDITVVSQGPDFDTKGVFHLKRIKKTPTVNLEISNYWCNAGDQVTASLNMINTMGIKVAATNITFDGSVLELADNAITARSEIMTFMSSNGTDWVYPVLRSVTNQIYPGQGSIIDMTFRCLADGYSGLDMTGIVVLDENGDSMLIEETNGSVTVGGTSPKLITIDKPDTGDICYLGGTCLISWDSMNAGDDVSIGLLKTGLPISEIEESRQNSEGPNTYTWTVPDTGIAEGNDYGINISSIEFPDVSDVSDGFFTISSQPAPVLQVSPTSLTFTTTEGINPADQPFTISNANGGMLDWGISDNRNWIAVSGLLTGSGSATKTVSIDASGLSAGIHTGTITVSSNGGTQNIIVTVIVNSAPVRSITVTRPMSGSTCYIGYGCDVSWISQNIGNYVSIGYAKGGGSPITIGTNELDDGSYTWNVGGSVPVGSDYRIIVTSEQYPSVSDSSNAFSIAETPFITIYSPASSTTCTAGDQCTITWTSQNTGNVRIELYKGGEKDSDILSVFTISGTGTYSYPWNVPTSAMGSDYMVRITSISNPSVYGDSEVFTISQVNPTLQVAVNRLDFVTTEGNDPSDKTFIIFDDTGGGLSWQITDDQTWITVSPPLSGSGTATKTVSIAGSGLSQGTHNGQIDITSNGGSHTIDVEVVVNPVQQDSTMTVTRPDGGENWEMGQSYDIEWTSTNGGNNVRIELLYNNQLYGPYNQIAPSTPNDGAFTWSIPGNMYPNSIYSVRITDIDTNAQDTSDAYFTLVANPILQVSPSSLTFNTDQPGNDPPSQPLTVTNGGTGTILFWRMQIATDNGGNWISTTIGSSTGPGTSQISVNTEDLSIGTYTGTLTITSSNAEPGSPQVVPVTLNIGGENPVLELNTDFMLFACPQGGPDPGVQTLDISNINPIYTDPMPWSISIDTADGTDWLATDSSSGTVSQGNNPNTISVTASPTYYSMAEGKYDGTITVTAPSADGSPRDVDVELYVTQFEYSIVAVDSEGTPGSGVSIPIYLRNPDPVSYVYVELDTNDQILPYYVSDVTFVDDRYSGMTNLISGTDREHAWFTIRSYDGTGRILPGEGPIAYINYDISPSATAGQKSPLDFYTFTKMEDDDGGEIYDFDQINGIFTVV